MSNSGKLLGANPEAEKLKFYPLFDWLRFVLASVVVLGHAGFEFAPFLTGGLAVTVFFALSGWLIGGILLRSQIQELPRFFFNRATRIWIPYGIAIGLLYTTALLKEGWSFYWFKYLILDVTFTHQLFTFFPAALAEMPMDGSGNQFWSISVEEQFYLIAPLILLLLPRGRSLPLWSAIAIITTAMNLHAGAIALGVCAAIAEARYSISAWKFTRWIASCVALACVLALAVTHVTYVLAPVFAVATVLALAKPGDRNPVAFIAGGLSYPLYLNHWIGVFAVHFVSKRFLPLDHGSFVIAQFILNVGLALALYWLVDRQIQLHRNVWYSRRLGMSLGAVAYALVAIGLVAGTLMHLLGPRGAL
ncbi:MULTISPECIES: acyltransferase family protein [unclassified Sphingobium]|uniref:acyltransferase family protein n=1 Tax=unclassified Sphingobium TaxID=2611147 RepID=UPI002224F2FB|nr:MULTISPECIES: acyltransferase [unclassified Sphingobium]MCW2395908.1 peptidoglycan/LPS O-acetylase OafA/YrhL [Sphingobium sp. B8D3B]MCW2419424.1 peptidoglycan/LPS O-acetylase OafA/YrhL [Sphingobium sp. B8D3C]